MKTLQLNDSLALRRQLGRLADAINWGKLQLVDRHLDGLHGCFTGHVSQCGTILGMDDAQPQVCLERIEVTVSMEQLVAMAMA